jgi:hypothetical protein
LGCALHCVLNIRLGRVQDPLRVLDTAAISRLLLFPVPHLLIQHAQLCVNSFPILDLELSSATACCFAQNMTYGIVHTFAKGPDALVELLELVIG